jgi:hypothetical protein
MRADREIPLEAGESALAELMPVSDTDDVLACIAQQIYWRVNDWPSDSIKDKPEVTQAMYRDAALMAYKMTYNAMLPEPPEYVEWKKSQQSQN